MGNPKKLSLLASRSLRVADFLPPSSSPQIVPTVTWMSQIFKIRDILVPLRVSRIFKIRDTPSVTLLTKKPGLRLSPQPYGESSRKSSSFLFLYTNDCLYQRCLPMFAYT